MTLAAEELSPFKLGQIQQLIADVSKDAGNSRVESLWFMVLGLGWSKSSSSSPTSVADRTVVTSSAGGNNVDDVNTLGKRGVHHVMSIRVQKRAHHVTSIRVQTEAYISL